MGSIDGLTIIVATVLVMAAAVVLFLVHGLFVTLRTLERRRKGLCLHCGYDLTANTSGVCPECGRAK
jgi:hypothetical protein